MATHVTAASVHDFFNIFSFFLLCLLKLQIDTCSFKIYNLKMLLVSMCLIYNHTFCLLTSIYVLLNCASARPIMCFIALILLSLVLNFMYGNLNLTVLFKFIVYMFYLLFNCLFLFDSKYILLHCIVLLHCKFVSLVNLFCP